MPHFKNTFERVALSRPLKKSIYSSKSTFFWVWGFQKFQVGFKLTAFIILTKEIKE